MKLARSAGGLTAVVLAGMLLAGCSLWPWSDKPKLELSSVVLNTTPHANNDSAIAVDLVLIYDQSLTDVVLKYSAADWFAAKDQLARDNPKGIAVHSWEVAPGQVQNEKIDNDQAAWTAVVFANYGSPGPHRARVTDGDSVVLRLGDDDIAIAKPGYP